MNCGIVCYDDENMDIWEFCDQISGKKIFIYFFLLTQKNPKQIYFILFVTVRLVIL
jgi:hypothetical protein